MSLTAEQLEARRGWLGGTDAAALAGVNPPRWAQPIDVYLEKRGLTQPTASSTMMSTGQLLEPVIADLFTKATGIRLRRPAKPVRSKAYPWAGGHLDRWAGDGCIFEAKWAMRADEWGPGLGNDGTHEAPTIIPAPSDESYQPKVPLRYAVQVQHYLAVTGSPLAYLAVLLGYGDFRWYVIYRDEDMIGQLMALEEAFWRDHVLAGVPPEPDGSDSYGRRLRELYAADDGLEAVATPEQHALVVGLQEAKAATAEAIREEARITQLVQDSMKGTAALVGPGFSISWRQSKPTQAVRWEELVGKLLREQAELLVAEGAPVAWPDTKKAVAEHVRKVAAAYDCIDEKPGARPFKPTFDSDEE